MTNEEKILDMLGELLQRVTKIEETQETMSERLIRVEVTQENMVLPNLQLLAEGHSTIQEQIRNLSVIDRLQDDVSTLKSAVRFLTQKIEQLESAM